jgi:hypothetical protein
MSDKAAKPTEPTAAEDLKDEIVAMFEEALARKLEGREPVESDAAVGDK